MEQRGIDTTRRCRPVGAIPPTGLEYRFKRFVSIVPTVGSRSNFFQEFPEAVFVGVVWNRVRHADAVRSGPFHRQDHSTVSKGPYVEIRPLDPAQIFSTSFRRLFSME